VTLVANGAASNIAINQNIDAGTGTAKLTAGNQIFGGKVIGTNADLTATNGIIVNTQVSNLKATNTNNGIEVTNAGALTLTNFGAGNAITNTNGGLNLTNSGTATVGSPINVGKRFAVVATGGGDINVNSSITGKSVVTSLGQSGLLQADRNINQQAATAITLTGAGGNPLQITAGNAGAGAFAQQTGASISYGGGNVLVTTHGAATMGGSIQSGDLTVTSNGGAIQLPSGTSSVGGNLLATSGGGDVTQSAALRVVGNSTINAGAGAITLDNVGNDFVGVVNLTGAATRVADANALTLGALATGSLTAKSNGPLNLGQGRVGGDLVADSGGSAITQSGTLTVSGSSNLTATGATISLNVPTNDFQGPVTATATGISIRDANALTVALVDGGTSTITAGGNLVVSGSTVGALNTTTTGGGTTTFGATNVGTNLATTSAGAVTQTGALTVAGTSNVNAPGSAITLNNVGNDFQGLVTLTGTVTKISDRNALTVKLATGETYIIANAAGGSGDLTVGGNSGNLVAVSNGGLLMWNGLSTANAILIAGTPSIAGQTAQASLAGITGPSSTGNVLASSVQYSNLNNATGTPSASGTPTPVNLTVNGELVLIANNLPRTGSGDFPSIKADSAVLKIPSLQPGNRVTIILNGTLRLLADTGEFRFRAGSQLPQGVTTLNPQVVKVFIGDVSITATDDELAQRSAIAGAQASALSSASAEARQSFGTDSVTQQIDMGFAGDVGIAATMGHTVPLEGEILKTPECVLEAKTGQACK